VKRTREADTAKAPYTALQGQYLAFIYAYSTVHRRPPAEADMQAFFRVTPPSVHQMVLQLERLRLIQRTPRAPRSIELLVPPASLPLLEPR
jgi:Mn-dependent DtxR family transcriptional regulator